MSDYEVINSYQRAARNEVRVRQRTAVYLDPRQPLYFQAAGRAVAVLDTDIVLSRQPAPPDAPPGAEACVLTSKGVNQCI